jgi:uncharacterized protein with PQ loop repeat
MNNLNFNRNEIQDQKQIPLKNSNISNSNIFNMQNLSSSSSSYDFMGLFILIAMLIKACAQIPIIIKVTQTKSAEDISIIMPIMFLISFSILAAISLNRKLYMPLLIFIIGIATSIILIIQKSTYEKSKDNYTPELPNYKQNNFQLPDSNAIYKE